LSSPASFSSLCSRKLTRGGPEGHSIVAEIAQRRLTLEAAAKVRQILGENASLASIASWRTTIERFTLIPPIGISPISRSRRSWPALDRQLAVAGLRLARTLNEASRNKGSARRPAHRFVTGKA
jgi:hypothetical protein